MSITLSFNLSESTIKYRHQLHPRFQFLPPF